MPILLLEVSHIVLIIFFSVTLGEIGLILTHRLSVPIFVPQEPEITQEIVDTIDHRSSRQAPDVLRIQTVNDFVIA